MTVDQYIKRIPEEFTEVVGEQLLLSELKNMDDKFEFIYATRFWAGVLLSVSLTLADPGFPTQEWYVTLSKFLGLVAGQFLAIKTIDRNADKKVEAAEIAGKTTTVTMPDSVNKVTATTQ